MWTFGTAQNFEELIEEIIGYTTDKTLHGEDSWELIRNEPYPRGTILKCRGLKGKDHLYIGLLSQEIMVGQTYRNWLMTKENMSRQFVWSPDGVNRKVPFNMSGNTVTLVPVASGLRAHQNVKDTTGAADLFGQMLAALEGTDAHDRIAKGQPRSFVGGQLLLVFGEAYPKQRAESKACIRVAEAALTQVTGRAVKIRCILENPIEEKPDNEESRSYAFSEVEIFSHSARVLYFGVFKQYSEGLDWYEQPGMIEFGKLPLLPMRRRTYLKNQSLYDQYFSDWTPPLMPCAGVPAIGIDTAGSAKGYFDFYLVKRRCGLTVVINNRNAYGEPNWETAYAGLFEPYADYEYPFPACIVGGTTGLSVKGEVRYQKNSDYPSPATGIRLDYRPANWSLTHGAATFAAAPMDIDGCPTQVCAMLPDGTWRTFANYVQGAETREHGHSTDSGYVYIYYFPNTAPVRPQNIEGFLRPTERDITEYHNYSALHMLHPLELVESRKTNGTGHHILGRIPGMYYMPRPIRRYGLIRIEGKQYLILPNVWDKRKFHLPYRGEAAAEYTSDGLFLEDRAKERNWRVWEDAMNIAVALEE